MAVFINVLSQNINTTIYLKNYSIMHNETKILGMDVHSFESMWINAKSQINKNCK